MPEAQGLAGGGQVAEQMDAGREEIRDHQDAGRPPRHATIAAGLDVGLGQLEETRLDDRIVADLGEAGGQPMQVVIGRRLTTAMGDQQDGGPPFGGLRSSVSLGLGVGRHGGGRRGSL
jgi:hypothetical protein